MTHRATLLGLDLVAANAGGARQAMPGDPAYRTENDYVGELVANLRYTNNKH